MVGSDSEHEFPQCDGHGGADFAETTDVKKPTGEVGFFTVPLQSWLLWTGKEQSVSDIVRFYALSHYYVNKSC
ncbi:hypothetical protein AB3H51_27115 [Escherichia coli]